jgi:hypothetical protein
LRKIKHRIEKWQMPHMEERKIIKCVTMQLYLEKIKLKKNPKP